MSIASMTISNQVAGTSRVATFVVVASLATGLAGCGGTSSEPSAPAAPSPPTSASPGESGDGRFVGTVTIGSTSLFGDALLTVDGSLRLYVGGPYESTGALQLDKPDGSAQFVGEVSAQGQQVSGSGMVIGQRCALPASDRFCDEPAPAEVRLTVRSGEARGEIEVTTRKGVETWTLNLTAWSNYYGLPARRDDLSGQFQEDLAEFAQDGDTILSIDDAGQLFFQSAGSGCTGNGIVSPHLDGNVNVYKVALTIASCDAPYTHLNGEFEGLATTTPGSYWDYDSFLRVWLSTSVPNAPPEAITMLATPR